MGEGVVLEQGTHQELLDNAGPYARLVQAQKLRETKETLDDDDVAVVSSTDTKKTAMEEIPLGRQDTLHSVTSDMARKKSDERKQNEIDEEAYSLFYLFRRIGSLARPWYHMYAIAAVAAIVTGMVFPVFSIIYGKAITGFSQPDPSVRREQGNQNALWFFIISIFAALAIGTQNYLFAYSAAELTTKLRILSFRTILGQDIQFFDREENNTGVLTSKVNGDPQKVNGLAGATLGAIIQALSTLIGGAIVGLSYAWKPALVGIACIPCSFRQVGMRGCWRNSHRLLAYSRGRLSQGVL
ncbi:ABC transporter type 1, transmembrane domain-containing protein [Scleroderma citrinum]